MSLKFLLIISDFIIGICFLLIAISMYSWIIQRKHSTGPNFRRMFYLFTGFIISLGLWKVTRPFDIPYNEILNMISCVFSILAVILLYSRPFQVWISNVKSPEELEIEKQELLQELGKLRELAIEYKAAKILDDLFIRIEQRAKHE